MSKVDEIHNVGQTSYAPNYPPNYAPNLNSAEKGYAQAYNANNTMNMGNVPADSNQIGQWGNFGAGLSDKVVRIRFIRKVYMILTAQLIFTFGIVCIFVFVEPVKEFARSNTGLYVYIASYISFIALIIIYWIMECAKLTRKTPYNYLLLLGFTITMTYMLSMVSAYHNVQAVLMAIGCTFLITLGVTLFATQTRFDFTANCWLVAICLMFALIGFGICTGIAYRYNSTMQGVYGGIGAVLMALFLAIDTQLLIGNKKYAFSAEDYLNATLQLYFDICYIFLYLLQLFGSGSK